MLRNHWNRDRPPKAHLPQVSGVKAISHIPDRDRVLPIVPEGKRDSGGEGRQQRTAKEMRQERNAINQCHETRGWLDGKW